MQRLLRLSPTKLKFTVQRQLYHFSHNFQQTLCVITRSPSTLPSPSPCASTTSLIKQCSGTTSDISSIVVVVHSVDGNLANLTNEIGRSEKSFIARDIFCGRTSIFLVLLRLLGIREFPLLSFFFSYDLTLKPLATV